MKQVLITIILWYLRVLAQLALIIHRPYIIGIAGSAGKSSARNAVYAVLQDSVAVKAIDGNSETGIPLGLLGLKPHGYRMKEWVPVLLKAPFCLQYLSGTSHIVVEMGIDDPYPPKNMEYLLSFMRPDLAVSLNVSATHTLQFEQILPRKKMSDTEKKEYLLQAIADEDTKIITKSGCHIAIYNQDDRYITQSLAGFLSRHSIQTFTFGSKKTAHISYGEYDPTLKGTRFSYHLRYGGAQESIEITLSDFLLPKVYQETIASAILSGFALGIPLQQIKDSLEKNFTLPKGRSSLLQGRNDTTIIDSTYNSSRRSVVSFLELVALLKKKTGKKVVFLCGDMNELGTESASEHTALLDPIKKVVDYLYCVGPETQKYIFHPLNSDMQSISSVQWFETARTAGAYLSKHLPEDTIVLAKGSQNRVFLEEAVKELILNSSDKKKLCRQEPYWMDIKNSYFNKQEKNISKNT